MTNNNHTQFNGFIVLQVLGSGSHQPVFANENGLMIFIGRDDAQREINDAIESVAEAIRTKDMSEDSRMTDDDYEIVPATIINPYDSPASHIIICGFDGDIYSMLRSEDDWHKVEIKPV